MILLLIPEGGYVEYKTVVRTVGILPDEIRGKLRVPWKYQSYPLGLETLQGIGMWRR
jgi:hypothetical protein